MKKIQQTTSELLHQSYLLILLVSFFFVCISFYQSLRVLDKAVLNTHKATLAQTKQYCENLIKESLATVDQITYYNPPYWLWKTDNTPQDHDQIAKALVVELLNSLHSIQGAYFPLIYRGDEILTHKGQFDINEFYTLYLQGGDLSLSDWNHWLKEEKEGVRKITYQSIYEERETCLAFYFNKLQQQTGASSSGGVILFLKTSALDRLIHGGWHTEGGQFFIVDSRQRVLHSWQESRNGSSGQMTLPEELNMEDQNTMIHDNYHYLVLHSDVMNWYYVFVSPLDLYKRPLRSFIHINIILMIVILLIGAYLLFLYLKYTYLPWKRLNEEVYQNRMALKGMHKIELALLLEQLMQDGMTDHTRKKLLDLGFPEKGVPCRILAFPAGNSRRSRYIYQLMESNPQLNFIPYMYLDCSMILFIDPPAKEILIPCLEEYLLRTQQVFPESLSFGLSPEFDSPENLKDNNGNAQEVMSRNLLMGYSKVILYEYSSDRSFYDFSFHLGTEFRFINNICLGELTKGLEIIRVSADQITKNIALPFPVVKIKIYGLVSLLLNGLGELEMEGSSRQLIWSEGIRHLIASRTIEESNRALQQVLKEIEDQHCPVSTGILERIRFYIDQNLESPDLSVGKIADEFGISISSLSTQFKGQYGLGVLNYIQKKRLTKAKEIIIRQNNLPLKEVAKICGFSSPLHMNRSFHKYEGVSPNKYKELNNKRGKR